MNTKDEVEGKSDHDLLIRIDTRTINMDKVLGNHLAHCDKREMIYLTVTLGSIVTAFLAVATVIVSFISRGV